MPKIVAIIPARYESSRFPGKPLAKICDKPMIQWVYEGVAHIGGMEEIYVATDDERIYRCVEGFGGKCIMTKSTHPSGSDRVAECVDILKLSDEDMVLNIQGDEPLIQKAAIMDLMSTLSDQECVMGTLKERIDDEDEIANPNIVKVVCDKYNRALYFSRSPIPYNRSPGTVYYRHVGVYAYRAGFLRKYVDMAYTNLENAESLEQLRALENGYKIAVKETMAASLGVDTPEQLAQIEKKLWKRDCNA